MAERTNRSSISHSVGEEARPIGCLEKTILIRTGATGSFDYAYDDALTGRQTSYSGLSGTGAADVSVTYGYWPGGAEASMAYGFYTLASPGTPTGTFNYGYDADGRPSSVTNPYGEATSWTYQPNGWPSTQTMGNASAATVATTSYAFNPDGLLTDLKNQNGSSSTLSEFGGTSSSAMQYDGLGNMKSMIASIAASSTYSGTNTYSYDSISGVGTRGQLTGESSSRAGSYSNSFAYDGGSYTATTGVGNPTTFRGASRSYNADNQDTASTYDGDGNPTAYSSASVSFDPLDRMTSYGSAETNKYDADDNRASIQTSSGTTYYVFDGSAPFLSLTSSGTVASVTTFGAFGTVSTHGSATGFYTWDPQGSIVQKLDSSGSVSYSRMYDAFGSVARTDSDTDPFASFGGQWGYFSDAATGLYQLGERFYDAGSGRFVNRDPIGYDGGINLYGYVGNGPIDAIDPSGFDAGWASVPGEGPWGPLDQPGSGMRTCRGQSVGPRSPLPAAAFYNPQKVNSLIRRIVNKDIEIKKRLSEYKEDPLGLPERAPGDRENPSKSRWGHRLMINQQKRELDELQTELGDEAAKPLQGEDVAGPTYGAEDSTVTESFGGPPIAPAPNDNPDDPADNGR